MKVKILGSGASEGIPSVFCHCPVCENARKVGGKEIRRRAGFLLDDTTLIDVSPDTFMNSAMGLNITALENVLITHTHSDHFDYETLLARSPYNAVGGTVTDLNIYGNERVVEKLENILTSRPVIRENTFVHLLKAGEQAKVGKYTVVPFYTKHIPTENCLVYLISDGEKYYFHCLDSDFPENEVFEYLRIHKIKLSLVILDCTYGDINKEFYGHMNLRQNVRVKEKLEQIGTIDVSTLVIANHVAHCCGETHETLSKKAAQFGIGLGYDGLSLQI